LAKRLKPGRSIVNRLKYIKASKISCQSWPQDIWTTI
jgi:hypothetical protein